MPSSNWKEQLGDQIPADLGREIDSFEATVSLRKNGKIDEKVFAEQRLRRGAYGQRYDNGQRHDGLVTQKLPYSSLTKGPDTYWDAPGMLRLKIPYGGVTPAQFRVLADLAEEYSDYILHVTTRQDFQLHFIHIEDTPEIFRRLAAVGITTREACGNSVRNVTACPLAGVCNTEAFDVTPYAKALAMYLLGHPDTQDFGRKFKIAFSGCEDEACALVNIHDLGGIAAVREVDGKTVRGFKLFVAGGLGAVPHQAKLFDEFVSEEDVFHLARAMGRVFARLGEKKNRNRARLKFLVQKLGIEEFKRLVLEELKIMPADPTLAKHLETIPTWEEVGEPLKTVQLTVGKKSPEFDAWCDTNVYYQRQPGYAVVTVTLPLGDFTPDQSRALADLAERYANGNARTTVEQNIVLRWVPREKIPALYEELKAVGLAQPGAGTIVDATSCPGTDTCKLGIASSRGLAGELRSRLAETAMTMEKPVKNLRIKVSGCFNSCGQHHVADLGFYGNSRNVGGFTVPHFQVMLGGQWSRNGGSYALAMGSVPSKAIPSLVTALTSRYTQERQGEESFQGWCGRIGKKELKTIVEQFVKVPPFAENPDFYTDWGDPRSYSIGDIGVGECAGEVVSLADFGFAAAESEAFEAQLQLDAGNHKAADDMAYGAMITAAKTLVQEQWLDVPTDPDTIVREFKTRFVDTGLFRDRFHLDQFSNYFLNRHAGADTRYTSDTAHKLVEETNLFIDAAHKCHAKVRAELAVNLAPAVAAKV
ncbi:MAG TPA: nitrite/sulfite reductase [Tepidisphaeraceae bacterium]|jgi:sulfite reductase (ferredoxin)|nr:nitrite/sulfite reductase [Tepidisphaeraceae bacterium]